MCFAAAGASDYPARKYLAVVAVCRAVRYSVIGIVADLYGRHFVRVIQHPTQYWGWSLLFVAMIFGLIATGILVNRRLAAAPAS
jgi:membrane protein DedA with SNARE-associated domain